MMMTIKEALIFVKTKRLKKNIDHGFFYCPYIPLQMVNVVDPRFPPKADFETRYGRIANPFNKKLTIKQAYRELIGNE